MRSKKINPVPKRVLIFSVVIFSLIHNCNTSGEEKSPVVATIDGREITLDEFRSFYDFDVNFGLDSSGYKALNGELLFYIDQIKARKKAEAEGLIRDSVFVKSYEWEKRQAILRQLYRQKISDNIEITDSETRNLYKKSQIQVRFRHLFFKSMDEARQAKL